jgi:hypothetical protein
LLFKHTALSITFVSARVFFCLAFSPPAFQVLLDLGFTLFGLSLLSFSLLSCASIQLPAFLTLLLKLLFEFEITLPLLRHAMFKLYAFPVLLLFFELELAPPLLNNTSFLFTTLLFFGLLPSLASNTFFLLAAFSLQPCELLSLLVLSRLFLLALELKLTTLLFPALRFIEATASLFLFIAFMIFDEFTLLARWQHRASKKTTVQEMN